MRGAPAPARRRHDVQVVSQGGAGTAGQLAVMPDLAGIQVGPMDRVQSGLGTDREVLQTLPGNAAW